ncbi:MAG TPA: hypothetical protein VE710_22970 [Candidatus Bathyarchaeia archaeon]|nr:hypothetical protein [Candidatus Bathyarchaeia archaeon]
MKWQYVIEENEAMLSALGEQGWELVSVLEREGKPRFYFKRPYPDLKTRITQEQRHEVFTQLGLEGST